MSTIDLRRRIHYNRWANHQILEVAAGLEFEVLTRDLRGSFPSVRDTLVHMMWAEWLWLGRWKGLSPQKHFSPADYPTLGAIRDAWAEVEQGQDRFLAELGDSMESRRTRYTNMTGEPWEYTLADMITHLVLHSAYHRGQVVTMLRQLGAVPVTTDFLVFVDNQDHSQASD